MSIKGTRPSAPGGARALFAASGVVQAIALTRFTVLARLLGPEQVGLVATLMITASFFNLITETGSEQFLIQDVSGDEPATQRLVQFVLVGRGFAVALALVLASGLVAQFYKAPAIAPALTALALAPLIQGFAHGDMKRAQRHLDFRAESISTLVGESVGLGATVIAAFVLRNFTAILFGLVARATMVVLVSHLMANRRYSLGYDSKMFPQLMRFSAPLMLSGIFVFFGSQGDRVIVANRAGLAALGQYSAVLLLVFYPASWLQRFLQTMYLPQAAKARSDADLSDRIEKLMSGQFLILGLAMVAGFAMVAPIAITVLFGGRYLLAPHDMALIGLLQASRFVVTWPTIIALGIGRSRYVLGLSASRLVAYPAALVGSLLVGGLTGVVAGFICGELVSVAGCVVALNRVRGFRAIRNLDRLAVFVVGCLLVVCWSFAFERLGTVGLPAWVALALCSAFAAMAVARCEAAAFWRMMEAAASAALPRSSKKG